MRKDKNKMIILIRFYFTNYIKKNELCANLG